MAAKVRWGHLREIRHVKRVPGSAFSSLPNRLKHLAAWRRMHVAHDHMPVRMYGTRNKVRPSSNLSLRKKLAFSRKYG